MGKKIVKVSGILILVSIVINLFTDNESIESNEKQVFNENRSISVLSFGADNTGATDSTKAIQESINTLINTGGTVILPEGNYLVSDTIKLYSNINIQGEGNVKIDLGGEMWKKSVFYAEGSINSEIPISKDIDTNTKEININNSNGLESDDYLIIKSQRDALSEDAKDFRLGVKTINSKPCYFGEFIQIDKVDSNRIMLKNKLIFTEYLTNNKEETSTFARTTATIAKVNFIQNININNLNFYNGDISANRKTAILQFKYSKNCSVNNTTANITNQGTFINFLLSLDCNAKDCTLNYDNDAYENYTDKNGYKCTSSQNSGYINCTAVNGTQPWDFTYGDLEIPTSNCYIKQCKSIKAAISGITTHPGTYNCEISDNEISHQERDGILVRGANHVVKNNNIAGVGLSNGILLAEGCGNNSVVENNNINGFNSGISFQEAKIKGRDASYYGPLNIDIKSNDIEECFIGVSILRVLDSSQKAVEFNVNIENNDIDNFPTETNSTNTTIVPFFINGDATLTCNNVYITNNTIDGNEAIKNIIVSYSNLSGELSDNKYLNLNKLITIIGDSNSKVDLNDN